MNPRITEEGTMSENDRDTTIKRIRTALRRRTGKDWSVTGGRGTAWGWIKVNAPPRRRTWLFNATEEYDSGNPGGHMSPSDRADLGAALGLTYVHFQGISIPASTAYRTEHVDRAEGREPTAVGTPYWD
jgi:hypothetical protein